MSKQIINIENLDRVDMFKKFINYPQPIGSATATLNINKLMKFKKRGHKLNSLINYCILKACYRIKEFHYLYDKNTLYYGPSSCFLSGIHSYPDGPVSPDVPVCPGVGQAPWPQLLPWSWSCLLQLLLRPDPNPQLNGGLCDNTQI